jgi:hypothetical protein
VPFQNLQNYTDVATWNGGESYRRLKPWYDFLTSFQTEVEIGPSLTKIMTFFTSSDEDKFYIKIIAFDEIYNFVVQFFHLKSF